MQNNETTALNLIIEWEGPEVNVSPSEPGGISKYGISLTTYADFCKKSNLPAPTANTISSLTEDDARAFYQAAFLPAIRFDDLPSGVDVRLADISINLGITGAVNLFQMILLQYPLTDTISNDHINMINTYTSKAVVFALSAGWISNKHQTAGWSTYGHGWSNRNIAVTQQCIQLVANT